MYRRSRRQRKGQYRKKNSERTAFSSFIINKEESVLTVKVVVHRNKPLTIGHRSVSYTHFFIIVMKATKMHAVLN